MWMIGLGLVAVGVGYFASRGNSTEARVRRLKANITKALAGSPGLQRYVLFAVNETQKDGETVQIVTSHTSLDALVEIQESQPAYAWMIIDKEKWIP